MNRMEIKAALMVAALISAVTSILVFIPTLHYGFVNWDDPSYILKNPFIRSLDLRSLKAFFTVPQVSNWHPLTMLSLSFDYALWGSNPFGYHLTNTLLHAVNTFLVAVLTVRLIEASGSKEYGRNGIFLAALVSALFFGIHPIHVESVVWVSERKDVLSALFFLLSVLSYLKYASPDGSKKPLYYSLTCLTFALALMSKPMAISLPIVLLILDFYPLERPFKLKTAILEKTPFFALSALSAFLTLWAQDKGQAMVSLEPATLVERLAIAVRAYGSYILKIFFPVNLAPLYPRPLKAELFNYEFFASLLFIIGITAFSIFMIKKRRVYSAAWLYYLITLVPVIGIVSVGAQAYADRYAYLPTLSLFILAGAFAGLTAGRHDSKKTLVLAYAVILLLTPLFSYLTLEQSSIWKDSIRLWTYELEKYPDRVPQGYLNRGIAFGQAGDNAAALADINRAIEIKKDFYEAYYNRAFAYSMMGEYGKAIGDLTTSLNINPMYADAYHNRGTAYANLGDYGAAIEDFKMAASLSPSASTYLNLGLAYKKTGDRDNANESFRMAASMGSREAMNYITREEGY